MVVLRPSASLNILVAAYGNVIKSHANYSPMFEIWRFVVVMRMPAKWFDMFCDI
ncbi:MAG: hypothetical protein KatS3mg113_0583 [Planctomycetaceae bacterium]|nr:MAG: hypothetical protein KatS3mg113_0583 [Planctomycetaceae bacterium]